MFPKEIEACTPIVARVLKIQDVTAGELKSPYLARYRGVLYEESRTAYDRLAADLKPLGITPLFRLEDGQQVILLLPGTINPAPSKTWIKVKQI